MTLRDPGTGKERRRLEGHRRRDIDRDRTATARRWPRAVKTARRIIWDLETVGKD